jgi:hypothetical protein
LGRLYYISSGLKIATIHGGLFDLKLENIKIGQSIEEINKGANPFIDLMKTSFRYVLKNGNKFQFKNY